MSVPRLLALLALMTLPIQAIDDAARAEVQRARSPWLEAPMRLATQGARPALLAGLALALVAGPAGRAFALEAGAALAPVNLLVEGTKYAVDRHRPSGRHRRTNASFPSSHAANAFAVAVVLARRWRRTALPALACASIVAYSRLFLDRHWLSDVVAGAIVGAGVAWCAVTLVRRRWRSRETSSADSASPSGEEFRP